MYAACSRPRPRPHFLSPNNLMPTLLREHDFKPLKRTPFCYLCGKLFEPSDNPTDEHVFARKTFDKTERVPSFVLPAHEECNTKKSLADSVMKGFLDLQRGEVPDKSLGFEFVESFDKETNTPTLGVRHKRLYGAVGQWLKGCHAALYGQPLPGATKNLIFLPMRTGLFTKGETQFDPHLRQRRSFATELKRCIHAKVIDEIVCNDGRVRYACVWAHHDPPYDFSWFCIFGLQVLDWFKYADENAGRLNCMGHYWPSEGLPSSATKFSPLSFPFPNAHPLDPFAE